MLYLSGHILVSAPADDEGAIRYSLEPKITITAYQCARPEVTENYTLGEPERIYEVTEATVVLILPYRPMMKRSFNCRQCP